MENEIIITKEFFEEFKNKYNLNSIEIAGIFNEERINFVHRPNNKVVAKLNNPKYAYELMTNDAKLKERVKELYESNKNARKIYNKVFGREEDILTKPCEKEELIAFRKRVGVSPESLAYILDVKVKDIILFEKGERNYFSTKNVNMYEYIYNDNAFYKLAYQAYKDGRISKKVFSTISSRIEMGFNTKKEKIRYVIRTTKSYDERKKILEQKEAEQNIEVESNNNEKQNADVKKVDMPVEKEEASSKKTGEKEKKLKEEEIKYLIKLKRRVSELRIKSKREEQTEFNGGRISCKHRKELINRLNELLEKGEKIESEDIELVKNAIMYSEGAISTTGIKVCVMGTLKSKGYNDTIAIINELMSNIDSKQYRNALKKFKEELQLKHEKEMKFKGNDRD